MLTSTSSSPTSLASDTGTTNLNGRGRSFTSGKADDDGNDDSDGDDDGGIDDDCICWWIL